jgi:DNA-directed RNA polymerase specialized sigma24 family protein
MQPGMPTKIDRRNSLKKVREMLDRRNAAIAKLKGPMRELVEMREEQGLPFAEIAAAQTRKARALGIRPKTEDSVRIAYSRILEKLGKPIDDSALPALPDAD